MPHVLDTKSVVERIYAAWNSRDLSKVLSYLSDDMVFALHVPVEVLPIGGETRGKTAVGDAFQGLLGAYDFLSYEPSQINVDGSDARAEVHFRYRDKATGEVIDSRMRHLWVVEKGLAARLDEWHDISMVQAFLGRVNEKLAEKLQTALDPRRPIGK